MKTRVEVKEGVAHLILDDPDQKVNTLGRVLVEELDGLVGVLARDPRVQAVVIRSAKPGAFIAGADVKELQKISLSPHPHGEALAASVAGQCLMNKIEDFPKPVVAAIHGACLGGGLELALACQARVVSSDPATQLGFPELKLGIVPGFGGTWRAPRLLGLVKGLEAILTSRDFDGRAAMTAGLADDLCFPEQLAQAAHALALKLLDPEAVKKVAAERRKKISLGSWLAQWPLVRFYVFYRSRAGVMARTRGLYPAPLRAIQVVAAGWGRDRQQALKIEAQALADTLASAAAANLTSLFFLSQDAKKQMGAEAPLPVHAAGVVGAGLMGSGIALVLADKAGIKTTLKDTSLDMLGRALKRAWDYEAKRLRRRQVPRDEAERRFHRISLAAEYGGLKDADLVVEAVPEVLDIKHMVYRELEAVLPEQAVIASNTSSLRLAKLAEGARNPRRFVGMHFFSPAEVMPLVEVIAGPDTAPKATSTVMALALRMGKTPVLVRDSPGFLVNRVLAAYALEAAQMAAEGTPAEKVDRAALAFGMPVGPIRLVAEVGVEVMRHVLREIREHFGEHLASPDWVEREDLAKAFEKKPDGTWKVKQGVITAWSGRPDPKDPPRDIQDRLYLAMLNESARCLEEGIVASPGLLDLAMVYGTGFPAFKGGPLREADARGLKAVAARARELAAKYGSRLEPAPLLMKMSENNLAFFSAEARH